MTSPRYSIYRNAFQVSPERIKSLTDAELNNLMGNLLLAQAYKCGSPISEVRINTEVTAGDDGCDGWSAKPEINDNWLGEADTCWQFKTGTNGQPARLIGEVTKRIPRETLSSGGRFVVVASGSSSGKPGEGRRRTRLVEEAVAACIPVEKIEVIGSGRLTNWVNQNPAIAAYWAGHPEGIWTLNDWLNSDEHKVLWQATDVIKSEIEARRFDLDFNTGNLLHLHIQGPPGVGKTRFALELCRDAAWRNAVIYVRDASYFNLFDLIDGAIRNEGIQLMIVADEIQLEHQQPLRDSIGRGDGRIRLITIGHCPSPDPARIPALLIYPLERQAMSEVVKGWHPEMPPEHVDFIVHFADGYVRLARLAGNAVAQNPSMNIRELLGCDEIRVFLDRMLGTGDRQHLHVVAVLTSVGWMDDKQAEGEAIARHFNLDWNRVRHMVDEYHRRFGIVPQGGRYRYISPVPLGIYLAVEAWNTYPDLLRTLPEVLPSEEARDAYFERLRSIASNPQAREFAQDELNRFFRLDDFLDAIAVRRWSALSAADPDNASRNILNALTGLCIDDRKRIESGARREVVWNLVRLAWRSSSFHDAIKALALLAEAENERWANNAAGEFVARFQIYLGGTAVPYLDRLLVLDELLAEGRTTLTRLVIKALMQVGTQQETRLNSGYISDELPEREWHPRTNEDGLECIRAALVRLRNIAHLGIPDCQDDLVAAAQQVSMMLRSEQVRDLVVDFYKAIRDAYPQTRELLRRQIAEIIHREKEYWKEILPEDLAEIESLHAQFKDTSLKARLLQYVGTPSWNPKERPDLIPLAQELYGNPDLIAEHWPWLTSGEAQSGWLLGEALACIDLTGKLAEIMPHFIGRGRDLRMFCSYIKIKWDDLGDEWYNECVDQLLKWDTEPTTLLFEVVWRCGATEYTARILADALRNTVLTNQSVGQLKYGN
jgi:DNA polymerase III delta prime subunit